MHALRRPAVKTLAVRRLIPLRPTPQANFSAQIRLLNSATHSQCRKSAYSAHHRAFAFRDESRFVIQIDCGNYGDEGVDWPAAWRTHMCADFGIQMRRTHSHTTNATAISSPSHRGWCGRGKIFTSTASITYLHLRNGDWFLTLAHQSECVGVECTDIL